MRENLRLFKKGSKLRVWWLWETSRCSFVVEEVKAGNSFPVWENADELQRYVWFADSSCAWRIPLDPSYGSVAVWGHMYPCCKAGRRNMQPPSPPKKGWPLNSQASGNICSPEVHTSCQLGSGWAQGLEKGLLGCSCGRRRKSRPGSFVALEGWGLSWAV